MKTISLAVALCAAAFSTAGQAALTITIKQSGTDVVATMSGTLDLTGLTRVGRTANGTNSLDPASARIGHVYNDSNFDEWSGFAGPGSFGPGGLAYSTHRSGSDFTFMGDLGRVILAWDFISGGSLAFDLSYADASLAGLGLATGRYVYASPADRITVLVGDVPPAAAVPEPAAWAMMIGGFGLAGAGLRTTRRRTLRPA